MWNKVWCSLAKSTKHNLHPTLALTTDAQIVLGIFASPITETGHNLFVTNPYFAIASVTKLHGCTLCIYVPWGWRRRAPKRVRVLVEQCNFVYEKWCIKPWFVNTVHGMYNITIFIDLYQPHQVHCFPTRSKFLFIIHRFKNTNFDCIITPILNYTETILRNTLPSPLQKTPQCHNSSIHVILEPCSLTDAT